jgi:hypothetical protein
MEDSNQLPQQMPIQSAERPTAVTVFGILSIVFGCMSIICTPISMLLPAIIPSNIEETEGYKVWTTVAAFLGIGFSIWLLITGIGLIKLKRWARHSAIIYSCVTIPWILCVFGINIAAFSLGWVKLPETSEAGEMGGMIGSVIGGTCGSLGGLIFPILLLIFMLTAKVKQAFAPLESGQALQQQ